MKKIAVLALIAALLLSCFAFAEEEDNWPQYDAWALSAIAATFESVDEAMSQNDGNGLLTLSAFVLDYLTCVGGEVEALDFESNFLISAFGSYTIDCYLPLVGGGYRNLFYVWEDYIKDYGEAQGITEEYLLAQEEQTYYSFSGSDVLEMTLIIAQALDEE